MRLGSLVTNRPWEVLLQELEEELLKWGVKDYILPFKSDAIRWGEVRLTLTVNGIEKTIPSGRFTHQTNGQEANLLAITQQVKATRLADQRGLGPLLAEVSSLVALNGYDPWRVLGAEKDDLETARRYYHEKLKMYHPDTPDTGNRLMVEMVQRAGKDLGL